MVDAKGLRRLDDLLSDELGKTRDLIRLLPVALNVPARRRITYAKETASKAREAAWRRRGALPLGIVVSALVFMAIRRTVADSRNAIAISCHVKC